MKARIREITKGADRAKSKLPVKRQADRRPWLWATASGLVGGVITYIFDPQQGRRRRSVGRDRLMGTIRHGTRRLTRSASRLEADTAALGKRLVHLKPASTPDVNDPTLEQRVQSEIFRDQGIPKDRISIAVQEGVVTLRGVVDQPEQIRDLEERTGKVVGVRGVESYLHLPNTPAPNKEDALRA